MIKPNTTHAANPPLIPRPRNTDPSPTRPTPKRTGSLASRWRCCAERNAALFTAHLIALTLTHAAIAAGAWNTDAYTRHGWVAFALHLLGSITATTIGAALVLRGMLAIPAWRTWTAAHLPTRMRHAALRRARRHLNDLDTVHIDTIQRSYPTHTGTGTTG